VAVTLKDIARECGLAVSTVSNILNNNSSSFASDSARQRVRETAERLGYKRDYLSTSLRTRKTRSVGLILDQINDITRENFVVPLVEKFSERGYEVALAEHRHDLTRAIQSLEAFSERFKEGVVLFSDLLGRPPQDQERLNRCVERSSLKILAVGSRMRGMVPSMDIDRGSSVERSLKHFWDQGHRKILVAYEYDWDMRPQFQFWERPGVTFWGGIHQPSDFLERLAAEGLGHHTAVFFRTDRFAIPALKQFRALGIRVPEDVEVISFDNFLFSQYTQPALTTWDIGFARLGLRSYEVLWDWIEGKGPDRVAHELYQPDFIARESHRGTM
jgi:DNA-binding LacI/PurR family transcriptional regulator